MIDLSTLAAFALLALPPVLLWTVFWRKRLAEPEPTSVLVQLFLFGVLSAVPLLALRKFLELNPDLDYFASITSPLTLIILFAFLEETLKGLALIGGVERNESRFDKWEDGFEFAVMIALGFAFAENILYFFTIYTTSGVSLALGWTYLFRSLGTMLGHILFTGTFGYCYAAAYVSRAVDFVKRDIHAKPLQYFGKSLFSILRRPFHITWRHLIRRQPATEKHYPAEVLIEGLLVAILLHALFNALLTLTFLGQSLVFLSVPIFLALAWWYARRWSKIKVSQLHS